MAPPPLTAPTPLEVIPVGDAAAHLAGLRADILQLRAAVADATAAADRAEALVVARRRAPLPDEAFWKAAAAAAGARREVLWPLGALVPMAGMLLLLIAVLHVV